MTAIVLQARLDSSRLPNKALLPLGGKPMIFRVMEILALLPVDSKILACPEDSISAFTPLADEAGFTLVPGSKEDVLARYCLSIRHSGADRIIRATGDNPFVFVDAAEALSREAEELDADYAAYSGLPYGAGVELIRSEALLKAERDANAESEREHVCPYLYNHPEFFRLHRPLAPLKWQDPMVRTTVDTIEDYERAEIIFETLLSLSLEERCKGENIIAAYQKLYER